jgi:hypothetical protein
MRALEGREDQERAPRYGHLAIGRLEMLCGARGACRVKSRKAFGARWPARKADSMSVGSFLGQGAAAADALRPHEAA